MADYDDKEGHLYLRFSEAVQTEGVPSDDDLVMFYRNRRNATGAVEILTLAEL